MKKLSIFTTALVIGFALSACGYGVVGGGEVKKREVSSGDPAGIGPGTGFGGLGDGEGEGDGSDSANGDFGHATDGQSPEGDNSDSANGDFGNPNDGLDPGPDGPGGSGQRPAAPNNCSQCAYGGNCNSACQRAFGTNGTCAVPGSTDPANCCKCEKPAAAPSPAPNNCSQCAYGGNCNSACQRAFGTNGTCAVPGSTDPGNCCSCEKPSPSPAPTSNCSQCAYGGNCDTACKALGQGFTHGTCAAPGSTDKNKCCACGGSSSGGNTGNSIAGSGNCSQCAYGGNCDTACQALGAGYTNGTCAVPGSTDKNKCCACGGRGRSSSSNQGVDGVDFTPVEFLPVSAHANGCNTSSTGASSLTGILLMLFAATFRRTRRR